MSSLYMQSAAYVQVKGKPGYETQNVKTGNKDRTYRKRRPIWRKGQREDMTKEKAGADGEVQGEKVRLAGIKHSRPRHIAER